MTENKQLSKTDFLEAIKRSGYILESEIVNLLSQNGFFVESNQVIEDPITGKAREIDLIAEYFNDDRAYASEHPACAKVKFVFEVKNNIYPLVLMTGYVFSPNLEIWESTKEIETRTSDIEGWTDSYYSKLLSNNEPIYTQYCSFETKKSGGKNVELFATHPEQVHTGVSKITQYCEEAIESWEGREIDEKYYRKFLYMPVLLISKDLFEMDIEHDKEPTLRKVEESRFIFNYYFKGKPKLANIWVVTRAGLKNFLTKTIKIERELEREMLAERINKAGTKTKKSKKQEIVVI